MKRTEIGFTLTHVKNELSPNEHKPVIDCFLDARWDREATRVHLKGTHEVTITGKLPHSTKALPVTAAIGFASFAWRNNDQGNPCLLDTGVTHIYLKEIEEGLKKGPYERNLKLVMNTAQRFEKGEIKVTFHKERFKPNAQILEHIGANMQHIGDSMVQFIQGNLLEEQKMRETIPGTERMRMPYDFSESGMQSTGGAPLPSSAYVLAEKPKTNTKYWENVFENVMRRDNSKWSRLNLEGQARATVLMLAYCAQYLDYVGDTIDRNVRKVENGKKCGLYHDKRSGNFVYSKNLVEGYENFGDAITTWSGDCEDLATAIAQCKSAFEAHKFPEDAKYDKFRFMQTISRQYVNPLSLDVVHGAQVNQIATLGAHMNDNFIPIKQFKDEMSRTTEGRRLLKNVRIEKTLDLPFMIGEGTGMYEPLGYDNPMAEAMRYVYQCPSLAPFKKPITHKRFGVTKQSVQRVNNAIGDEQSTIGSFFVGSLIGMTDYFYLRGATSPTSFWYCTQQDGGELTRGATYNDMIFHPERVALRPQPDVPRPVMGLVEEAVKLRVPPRPLVLTKSHEEHKTNKHLDRVVQGIKKLNRAPVRTGITPNAFVPVYIRPHQLSTDVANRIITDFTRLEHIYKVDYHLEEITDDIWGYQMKVYVK